MNATKFTLALLVFTFILSSFSTIERGGKVTKWIPDDFDTRNSTLLVQNWSIIDNPNKNLQKAEEKATEDMKAEMKADYPYKFEFARKEDIKSSSKYADKSKYRWVLWVRPTISTTLGAMSSNSSNECYIYDRKNDVLSPGASHKNPYATKAMKPALASIVEYLKALKPAEAPQH